MVVDICSCKEENVEEDHFRKIQGIGLEVECKRGEGDIWHEFVKRRYKRLEDSSHRIIIQVKNSKQTKFSWRTS